MDFWDPNRRGTVPDSAQLAHVAGREAAGGLNPREGSVRSERYSEPRSRTVSTRYTPWLPGNMPNVSTRPEFAGF